jgi:hypothetical protein
MATPNQAHQHELDRRYDELYEQYGKPLEVQHRGQYLAISTEGRTLLGATLLDVAERAEATFGPGNFLYKIGDKAVGKWRWASR